MRRSRIMAFGWLSFATLRPDSAFMAVRTWKPSSFSIRANVCVTPSSSSTIRIVEFPGSAVSDATYDIVGRLGRLSPVIYIVYPAGYGLILRHHVTGRGLITQ